MQIEANDEIGRFVRMLPILVGIGAITYWFIRPAPAPPVPNSIVFGCYSAANGPNIFLDGSGIHVRQAGYPIVPFHLERSKTGILLTAEAPIRADRTPTGYRFGVDRRGIGKFLSFYRVQDGRTYGVFEEAQLAGFQMLASDGEYLNYDPAAAAQCVRPTE